jgi:hypothetical protein
MRMRKALLTFSLIVVGLIISTRPTLAQPARVSSPSPSPATQSATVATDSAELATASATTSPSPQPKSDITEVVSQQKDVLTAFLDANPPQPLTWYNPLQYGIRQAIAKGLPANIIVLLILFPIITSIIAASRHIIGLQGFGIYIPAVLSVAFVSTGIITGVLVFAAVLAASLLLKNVFKRLRLQYLPRTALLLWGVSFAILGLLITTSIFGFNAFLTLNIFPLLIIMLLTENFMETQLNSSRQQTIQLTLETLLIAVLCSLMIGQESIQKAVLLRPELTFAIVAVFNLVIGKYSGLRLLEFVRFRSLMEG